MCAKKRCSPAGNRTRVFRVTGGDTDHYTTEEGTFLRSLRRVRLKSERNPTKHQDWKWSHCRDFFGLCPSSRRKTRSFRFVSKLYTDCARRRVGILRRLRNKLNSTAFRKIFIGAIRPKIEYACGVWSGGPTGKIAKLQDAYCRRHQIHLPPLKNRFEYHTLTLFFKMNIKWCRSTCLLLCLLQDVKSLAHFKFQLLKVFLKLTNKFFFPTFGLPFPPLSFSFLFFFQCVFVPHPHPHFFYFFIFYSGTQP